MVAAAKKANIRSNCFTSGSLSVVSIEAMKKHFLLPAAAAVLLPGSVSYASVAFAASTPPPAAGAQQTEEAGQTGGNQDGQMGAAGEDTVGQSGATAEDQQGQAGADQQGQPGDNQGDHQDPGDAAGSA